MPPHLLDSGVLGPLAPFLAALEQRDRASLSLACKVLYATVLTARNMRCIMYGNIASFLAWLERLESSGGCAGLAVELLGGEASPEDALATMCQLAAVGPTELHMNWSFSWRLDSQQLLRAIQALGAGTPCRLRTLCIDIDGSALPALDAIATLERLECSAPAPGARQWQPNLPQLTVLFVEVYKSLKLGLDGVPALQQLTLRCGGKAAATVSTSTPLGSLKSLRFSGAGELSFPWQQVCGLEELALLGIAGCPTVHGTKHLSAITGLRSLALMLPLGELPTSPAWLGNVTALETNVTAHDRQDGIHQALGLIAGAANLAELNIQDYFASGVHILSKWAWALLKKAPGSLKSVRLHVWVYRGPWACDVGEFKQDVAREADEGTAAMLGRLMTQADLALGW